MRLSRWCARWWSAPGADTKCRPPVDLLAVLSVAAARRQLAQGAAGTVDAVMIGIAPGVQRAAVALGARARLNTLGDLSGVVAEVLDVAGRPGGTAVAYGQGAAVDGTQPGGVETGQFVETGAVVAGTVGIAVAVASTRPGSEGGVTPGSGHTFVINVTGGIGRYGIGVKGAATGALIAVPAAAIVVGAALLVDRIASVGTDVGVVALSGVAFATVDGVAAAIIDRAALGRLLLAVSGLAVVVGNLRVKAEVL